MAGQKGSIYFEGLPYNEFASVGGVDLAPLYARMKEAAAVASERLNADLGEFCEFTTLGNIVWGGNGSGFAQALDEFGFPDSTKADNGLKLGIPMKRYGKAISWSRPSFKMKTTGDLVREFEAAQMSLNDTILLAIRNAIYNNDNYTFEDDYGVGTPSLTVRRFINADSAVIPNSPWGDEFTAASHNHYVAKAGATLAVTDLATLIANVLEHGDTKGVKLIINRADVSDLAALPYNGTNTTGFAPLTSALLKDLNGLLIATTADSYPGNDYNDCQVGVWVSNSGAVPVFVKPWAVENYILCIATGGEKPLMAREPIEPSMRGISITQLPEGRTNFEVLLERYLGIGVFNRGAGAILYNYSTETTYADPTLTHGGKYGNAGSEN
jgi:hypothetical protein